MLHSSPITNDADWPLPEGRTVIERTLFQIILKTVVTHALALISYGQFTNLIHVPSKQNVRVCRLLTFALLPTVLLGQLAVDLIRAAIRVLQNPHELNYERSESAWVFYFEGILGARAVSNDPEEPLDRDESTHLLDVPSIDDAQRSKRVWNWKRASACLIATLALLQATGVIIIFTRRSLHQAINYRGWMTHDQVGLDFRNMYIAAASIICSTLSLYLLLSGNIWSYQPSVAIEETEPSSPLALSELKRVVLEFIIGGCIQEFIAIKTYHGGSGVPKYWTCFLHTLDTIRMRPAEWVLVIIAAVLIAIFRHDIVSRLNVKIRYVYVGIVAALALWIALDTVGLLVTDIAHFATGHFWQKFREGERWSDPLERWIPII